MCRSGCQSGRCNQALNLTASLSNYTCMDSKEVCVLQEVCGQICSATQGWRGGMLWDAHLFHCENFLASFSTCAQSVPPRIQSRVPPPLAPSCASGTTHLTSSTLGHGQSTGLLTHTSVSWQRYSEQETVINIKKRKMSTRHDTVGRWHQHVRLSACRPIDIFFPHCQCNAVPVLCSSGLLLTRDSSLMNTPLVICIRLSFDFIMGNFSGITDNNKVMQGC